MESDVGPRDPNKPVHRRLDLSEQHIVQNTRQEHSMPNVSHASVRQPESGNTTSHNTQCIVLHFACALSLHFYICVCIQLMQHN